MLPRGMTLHFRYRTSFLDPPFLGMASSGRATGTRVLVCYAYQDDRSGVWEPRSVRPLRAGKIVDVQLSGPEIHIYFELDGYPRDAQSISALTAMADAALRKEGKLSFASMGASIDESQLFKGGLISSQVQDAGAFTEVIDQLPEDEVRTPDQYDKLRERDPLFYRVQGIYKRGKRQPALINPTSLAGVSNRQHGYVLRDGNPIELRIQFHQPKWSKIDNRGLSLVLETDERRFSVPQDERMAIESAYDQAQFYILPLRDNDGWMSRLAVSGRDGNDEKSSDVADFSALVRALPKAPPLLVRTITALSPTVTVFLAIVSIIVAFSAKANPASTVNPLSQIPLVAWAIGGAAMLIVALSALLQDKANV
jgi:hypothetical protein